MNINQKIQSAWRRWKRPSIQTISKLERQAEIENVKAAVRNLEKRLDTALEVLVYVMNCHHLVEETHLSSRAYGAIRSVLIAEKYIIIDE